MKNISPYIMIILLTAIPNFINQSFAHEPAQETSSGPLSEIVLTQTMISNLGIKTVPAEKENVSNSVDLVANIDYLPEKQAVVSAGAEGTITKILVSAGQKVEKNQDVLIMQPRFLGNPAIHIKAPMTGYITEQNILIGQAVSVGQPLIRIADISQVLVRGFAYEGVAQSGFGIGQDVSLTTPSLPEDVFTGKVRNIDATLQAGTRTRAIDAIVENPDGKLLANMQARLSIKVGDVRPALTVPQRAILGEAGNYFLYVQNGDHFYRRDLKLGQKFGYMREVIEGLSPNEDVVVIGNYQLQFIAPANDAHKDDDHGHAH
jgi:multidrug efflux pump subunit AcrA (membrane-fusion protein)